MKNIEDIIASHKKEKSPGCALAVIHGKNTKLIKTVGYADLQNNILVSPQTNFRLASISKQFMAVGIMILVQQKKISLKDRLQNFFPNFSNLGQNINIHHLLVHSSGLVDYENLISKNQIKQIHDEDVLDLLKNQKKMLFSSGSRYSYSNGGYCLLRLIIEKVSKQDIGSFLNKYIFSPLKMTSTLVNYEGKTSIPNRAYGYSHLNGVWQKTDQNITSATIGDGGLYSSITDMQKWPRVFFDDKVLSEESRNLMLKKHILTDEGKDVYYGYGLFLKNHHGKNVAYHDGISIGFQTGIYYSLDEEKISIFLSNKTGEDGAAIAEKIFDATAD